MNNSQTGQNIYSNSDLELRFLFPNLYKKEEFTTRTPDAIDYLRRFAPNRVGMLNRILRKINFRYPKALKVDFAMPMGAAGYFAVDLKYVAISPMFLISASEAEIAHVLIHEGIHAGIYTNGVEVMDEVLTESIAKKKTEEIYGDPDAFASGYQDMVLEMKEFFGDLSFDEMIEKIESGDEETFDNVLDLIVIRPLLKSGLAENLTWKKIESSLHKKWDMIKRLFPRIINSVDGRNAGVRDEAVMNIFHYKLEKLMKKAASKFTDDNRKLLSDIFLKSIDKKEPEFVTEEYLTEKLWENGYGYLLDFENEKISLLMSEFLAEYNIAKAINPLKQRKNFLEKLRFNLDLI